MRIFRHVAGLPDFVRDTSVAIGNFDGVHLGHQAVIARRQRMPKNLAHHCRLLRSIRILGDFSAPKSRRSN
jgi:riboflavin kinase/FMN adenylyltransferase